MRLSKEAVTHYAFTVYFISRHLRNFNLRKKLPLLLTSVDMLNVVLGILINVKKNIIIYKVIKTNKR